MINYILLIVLTVSVVSSLNYSTISPNGVSTGITNFTMATTVTMGKTNVTVGKGNTIVTLSATNVVMSKTSVAVVTKFSSGTSSSTMSRSQSSSSSISRTTPTQHSTTYLTSSSFTIPMKQYIDMKDKDKSVSPILEDCHFAPVDGFLRMKCRDTVTGNIYYKCHNSDHYYRTMFTFSCSQHYTLYCPFDTVHYQSCMGCLDAFSFGGDLGVSQCHVSDVALPLTDDSVCGAFVCVNGLTRSIESGHRVNAQHLCNGSYGCYNTELDEDFNTCEKYRECGSDFCSKDAFCKEPVGQFICDVNRRPTSIELYFLCDGRVYCDNASDEADCNFDSPNVRTCIATNLLGNQFTRGLNKNNTCYIPELTSYNDPKYRVCDDYKDQMNCTNMESPIFCKIDGYDTNLSKHVLCKNLDLCDDNVDSVCSLLEGSCVLHKHQFCDGAQNCRTGSDELSFLCTFTEKSCVRRVSFDKKPRKIPLSWIMDGIVDCINGIDEDASAWPKDCGNRKSESTDCSAYGKFNCYNIDKQIGFLYLCKKMELVSVNFTSVSPTCESSKRVCKKSRGFPTVEIRAPSHISNQLLKTLQYCLPGLTDLQRLSHECITLPFISPNYPVYGINKTILQIPNVEVDCTSFFGELYVFRSCLNLCKKATCPLNKIDHLSCKRNSKTPIFTIANSSYITSVRNVNLVQMRSVFLDDLFACDNGFCVSYDKVCNLHDDCGDSSDEHNCTNHHKCNLNYSVEYISLAQVCDGHVDCLDYSDECNGSCNTNIIDGLSFKIVASIIAIVAAVANSINLVVILRSVKKISSKRKFVNLFYVAVISFGDLLTGLYLFGIVISDSYFRFNHDLYYCQNRYKWLSGAVCASLGVLNQFGTQISLFAMTILSYTRLLNVAKNYPSSKVSTEFLWKNFMKLFFISVTAGFIAFLPFISKFEDFFVNGLTYNANPMFVGAVNKRKHIDIIHAYYDSYTSESRYVSWVTIRRLIKKMFSVEFQEVMGSPVHFYGNDGVCLFKYFVTAEDPQRAFTWSIILINLTCFVLISIFYLIVYVRYSSRSTAHYSSKTNKMMKVRKQKLQWKITLIIMSDFLCWIPFITVCILHYAEVLDATILYPYSSLIVLPINAVINPIIYNKTISKRLSKSHPMRVVRYIIKNMRQAKVSKPEQKDEGRTEHTICMSNSASSNVFKVSINMSESPSRIKFTGHKQDPPNSQTVIYCPDNHATEIQQFWKESDFNDSCVPTIVVHSPNCICN